MARRRIATLHKVSSLTRAELCAYGRSLRLEWACQGDRAHAAGVAAMVAESERIGMRRGIAPCELS
jgi:hypothetical protein